MATLLKTPPRPASSRLEVGFKYEASFSRSFRKVYGVSPSDYAQQKDAEGSASEAGIEQ